MLFQNRPEVALRFGRFGPELDRMAEPGSRLLQVALRQRGAAFGDVQIHILVAIISSNKLAALVEFGRGFLSPARPRQSQAKLIVTFPALWLQPSGLLQFLDGFGHFPVLKQRFPERQVGPRERRGEGDDFSQLIDLIRRPHAGTSAIGYRQVELSLDSVRCQCHRLLEFADGFPGVGGGEGRPQIGVRIRVIRPDAYGFTQRRDTRLVVACLYQHESEMIVGFGVIWLQPNGFTELSSHFAAFGARAAEHQTQRVVRVCPARVRTQCLPESGNGSVPVWRRKRWRREVQPGFELSQRLIEIAREEIGDSQVDIDSGGGWEERDRVLQAYARCGQVPLFAQGGPQKGMARSGRGVEAYTFPQLGQGSVLSAAVPQRDAEIVMGLSGFRPERDRALQVSQRGRQISLLAQNEPQQVVRLGVMLVNAEGLCELCADGVQVTPPGGLLGTLVQIVRRARC